jgi:hypothetical protein
MTDQSGSPRLWVLFEAALNDYERQTNITLEKHALAEQLLHCYTVESVTTFLQNQVRACSGYQRIERNHGFARWDRISSVLAFCQLRQPRLRIRTSESADEVFHASDNFL